MLHKLIEQNDTFLNGQECPALDYEKVHPYQKSLYTYYKDRFGCEPVLLVNFLTNACCGCYIAPADEWEDIMFELYETEAREIVAYNSKMFKDCL